MIRMARSRRLRAIASAYAVVQLAGCAVDVIPPDALAHPAAAATPGSKRWIETLGEERAGAHQVDPTGRFDDIEPSARRPVRPPELPPAPTTPARFRKVVTEHLGQWTARLPNRIDALGFSGTDLGISFPHRGELWFLFGDSQSVFDYCSDSIARTSLGPLPERGLPALDWLTRPNGLFQPIAVPGVDLGFMNVAVEGLSIDDETAYLFLATQWSDDTGRHRGSAVAHSPGGDLETWTLDHAIETYKFVNVSAVRDGPYVYIWGSGDFRKSDVYLARVPVESVADRTRWEYFRTWSHGAPTFGPGEASARAVVSAGCVGELSARRHPRLGVFMLAYNCEAPRGVFLRTADHPAGPYSEPVLLFEPWRDKGYEHFMHIAPELIGHDDGLGDPGRESGSGGEYGPYLVPEWFSEELDGSLNIVYTLSSWNPYQVHVMRTTLADAKAPLPPSAASDDATSRFLVVQAANAALNDMASWEHAGDQFAMAQALDGTFEVSSDAQPLGAAGTGTLWKDFSIDEAVSRLEFEIRGNGAEVMLVADDEVVRRARGRGDDRWRPVVFQLAGLRGKALRIAMYDRVPGGFVALRGLQLR
jgi:hypothetical protein